MTIVVAIIAFLNLHFWAIWSLLFVLPLAKFIVGAITAKSVMRGGR